MSEPAAIRAARLLALLADDEAAIEFAAKARYDAEHAVTVPWESLLPHQRAYWLRAAQRLVGPVLAALRSVGGL